MPGWIGVALCILRARSALCGGGAVPCSRNLQGAIGLYGRTGAEGALPPDRHQGRVSTKAYRAGSGWPTDARTRAFCTANRTGDNQSIQVPYITRPTVVHHTVSTLAFHSAVVMTQ